jgi:hypothetical protein
MAEMYAAEDETGSKQVSKAICLSARNIGENDIINFYRSSARLLYFLPIFSPVWVS